MHLTQTYFKTSLLFVAESVVLIGVKVIYNILAISFRKLCDSIFSKISVGCDSDTYFKKLLSSAAYIYLLPLLLILQNEAYGSKSGTLANLYLYFSMLSSSYATFWKKSLSLYWVSKPSIDVR